MKYTQQNIGKLGTILGVWAHPDDEAFGTAGLMSGALANGQKVVIITATKGDAGETADEQKWPKDQLTEIREKELEKSLEQLSDQNKIEHHWLEFKDGKLKDANSQKGIDEIVKIIEKVQPDTVLSFDADGITGHDDHKTIHHWTRRALEKSSAEATFLCVKENKDFYESIGKKLNDTYNMYFNTNEPEIIDPKKACVCYVLNDDEKARKRRALSAHASQTSTLFNSEDGQEALEKLCECECFVELKIG